MPVEKQSGVGFLNPGSYLVFKTMSSSLWTCSKSLMLYSIQFINNYKFLLWLLLEPAFLLFFLSPTSPPFWFCTWWEMVGNASSCCWFHCLLIILLQTIQKHKHIVNSTHITWAILYPNVLICFKELREDYQQLYKKIWSRNYIKMFIKSF